MKPELELFDSGDIAMAKDFIADGRVDAPAMCSIVTASICFTATPIRSPMQPAAFQKDVLGLDWHWPNGVSDACSIIFIGWPCSLWNGRHVTFSVANLPLVTANLPSARDLIEKLGGCIAAPEQAREFWALPPNYHQ